jgi:hypothetical protein
VGQEPLQFLSPSGIELHLCTAILCIILALMVSLSWTTLRELRTIRSLLETQTKKSNEKEGGE